MLKKLRRKQKNDQRKIAAERISILFKLADEAAICKNLKDADHYINEARKIAMKFNMRIPKGYRGRFCKYCYRYLLPSTTSRVRINSQQHRVEVKCLECNRVIFYPFIREIKERGKK